MTEPTTPPAAPPAQPPAAPPAQPPAAAPVQAPVAAPTNEGMSKADEFIAKITAREKALDDKEKAINAKIAAIDEATIGGQSISQQQMTDDEKNIAEANKLMEGTGFSFTDEPHDAFAPKKPPSKKQ